MTDRKSPEELNRLLIDAVNRNELEKVAQLLRLGADASSRDEKHFSKGTALITACCEGFTAIASVLLENGADVNMSSNKGYSALLWATSYGLDDIVTLLINAGADVHHQNNTGQTAVMLAAQRGHHRIIGLLQKAGIDINHQDNSGSTALHLSALHGHNDTVEVLLKHDADSTIRNKDGENALQMAEKSRSSNKEGLSRVMNLLKSTEQVTTRDECLRDNTAPNSVITGESSGFTVQTLSDVHTRPEPVFTSRMTIGMQGGKFAAGDVTVTVPEDAVSTAATFCVETYYDSRMTPTVDERKEEVVLSPATRISTTNSCAFQEYIRLSLPAEVPFVESDPENGWEMELKRCDGLPSGRPDIDEWQTILTLNTSTGKAVSLSPMVESFDSSIGAVYLDHFSVLSWVGRALSRKCQRRILYAVFAKEVSPYKWSVSAHIFHGSPSVIANSQRHLERRSYIMLGQPRVDLIHRQGTVTFRVEGLKQWQICGRLEATTSTERIWHSRLDGTCFHEVVLEDATCLSQSLDFTVEASFQSHVDPKHVVCPIEMNFSHPVVVRGVKSMTSSLPPSGSKRIRQDHSARCQILADKVRNEADRLGGLWKGGTAFPIHVLKDVCSIAAKRNRERILADHLPDYRVVSAQSAHQMLKGWIEEKGDDATLESLFQAAYEAGLFDALEQEINRRIEQQSPVDGK
jgi:ankyrin repeat protein